MISRESISFSTATFKEFENIEGHDMMATAKYFKEYIDYQKENNHYQTIYKVQNSPN